ncbi:WD40 repeat domain-containing serine/threonine protein kinase [Nannocystis bainbridge]|uniref:Serine/threonine-protein kinase n=1 Tax=Nannocystis bainbridge TaxID=2995303 RepID=A0ABT5DV84_9BACT|nr:serine/threonine-protein kinase [Nannocystis bainbridge]MDC0717548.1 serine/threonine-protein kinase [Nannocystis bainbridge]
MLPTRVASAIPLGRGECGLSRGAIIFSCSSDHGPSSRHTTYVTHRPAEPDRAPSTSLSSVMRAARDRLLDRLDALPHAADEPAPAAWQEHEERYQFGAPFAAGGLGVIRRAYDRRLRRVVAVKELRSGDPAAARRFELEAAITARLEHPAIVPLYDVGRSADGEPYYCMKLVDGDSLEQLLGEQTTLAGRLVLLEHLLTVADAIAYAHDHGVIHRDLKPSNILVGAHGETVVIDWGLAKDTRGEVSAELVASQQTEAPEDATLTDAGTIVGTPRYMPPEQARGEKVDARSDVFSLGAVLFHLLVGRPPFAGLERQAVLHRLADDALEDPRPLAAAAPLELLAVVQKAMSPRPGDRYPGAQAFAADLRRFLTGRLVDAHHYRTDELLRLWLRRHSGAATVAALALITLAATTLMYLRAVGEQRDRAELARAESERRATGAALAQARAALGEDLVESLALLRPLDLAAPADLRSARLIALAAAARGAPDRVLRGHVRSVGHLAALADGGLVSIDGGGAVWRWNFGTGSGRQIVDLASHSGTVIAAAEAPVWAALADERALVFRGDEPPEPIELAPLGQINFSNRTHRWELSRGGETLAALQTINRVEGREFASAYLWDLRQQPARRVEPALAGVYDVVMSPDGQTLALFDLLHGSLLQRDGATTLLPELGGWRRFSPKGDLLVGSSGSLDLASGTRREHEGRLLAVTPDDRALVLRPSGRTWASPEDQRLALIDLRTGTEVWETDLQPSRELRGSLWEQGGGLVTTPRGDRFALRYQHNWILGSMTTGKVLRILEVGDATRATFLADGSFVAVHHHDLWLWDPEPLSGPIGSTWIAAAPDGQHILVTARDDEPLHVLARADASTRPLGCPVDPEAWKRRAWLTAVVLDERGRVLARTAEGGACLQDETGATRTLAVDGTITTVALSRRSESFAVGLEDGRVLLYGRADAPLSQWQLVGPLERLWALTGGADLIAATREGQVFALRSGLAAPLSLGTLREPQEVSAIAVASHPTSATAVLGLPRADRLLFYAGGEITSRPAVLLKPNLAYSPSGARAAITLADRRLLVVTGADDPGREIALPEGHDIDPWPARLSGTRALQFVDEDTIEAFSDSSWRVRVDLELGEAFVIEHETSLGSLGLGLRAPDAAELLRELGARYEVIDPVPRDRLEFAAWLAARTR